MANRLFLVVLSSLLMLWTTAQAQPGQQWWFFPFGSGSGSSSSSGFPSGSTNPVGYCNKCFLPKGFSRLQMKPNQECINKRVICWCQYPGSTEPVKTAQPLCLYPAVRFPSTHIRQ